MFYLGRKSADAVSSKRYSGADCFLLPAQTFINILVVVAIVYILITVTLFITSCNKRRNYYITNYVSVALNVIMSAFVGLFTFIFVAVLMGKFYGEVDWAGLEKLIEVLKADNGTYYEVSKSPLMFILGFLVSLIVIANGVVWTLNLIWKIKLMKGEKELLANGLIKEVA